MATDQITFVDAEGTSYSLTLTTAPSVAGVDGTGDGSGTDDGTGVITAITGTIIDVNGELTGVDGTVLAVTGPDNNQPGADNEITSTSSPYVDLNGVAFDTASDGFLIYTDGNGDIDLTDNNFLTTNGATTAVSNVTFEVLCYLRGTFIQTPSGEVRVEDLRIGDQVSLPGGGSEPVQWIGQARVLVKPGTQSPARPVLIRRNALADNVPHRDLYVTKGHALYLDGHLIPAEFLVNHRTILWDDRAREVEYYHIELASHQVILANGALAETYRDEANRWMFHNATPDSVTRDVAPFAPVVTGGPVVDKIWAALLDRAGPRAPLHLTREPDVHLLINGQRINPLRIEQGRVVFALPGDAGDITIASRAARPDMLGSVRDPRRLGVAIGQILLWQNGAFRLIQADDAALQIGFHNYEPDQGHIWTNGQALLPAHLTQGATELHLAIRHTTDYVMPAAPQSQAA